MGKGIKKFIKETVGQTVGPTDQRLSWSSASVHEYCVHSILNKARYTATLVACWWAGAVLKKVTRVSGQKLKKLKNAKKVKRGPTDRPTNGPT